ncbi:MAG: ABC transporter substrate-binding protein, partial [Clostridia bacterium]|nr:ABC transporter substrate-binding protein [Clostridia bacterium]
MRKLFCVLLTLCIVLLLFGCHGSNGRKSFDIPDTFDTSREYEISFWAKNENNENQRAVYEDAIAAFETLYPNINVTIKHYTDYGMIYNDVITNISTDTTPNVCITYPDHIATYI